MIENFQNLIIDIKTGRDVDAFEAAKKIAGNKISKSELTKLANIVTDGIAVHNKEAATYAISWAENGSSALAILIDILGTVQNHERIRGQAAEGIGLINPSRKFKLRMAIEDILIRSLKDSSPIVRFWSCYAVGRMKIKKVVPMLKELQANDHVICPGWWYISEEAEDAIEWINNRKGKERISVNQRGENTKGSVDK
jgi:hypothetical protein